jgi:hypothetical protein
MQKRDLLRKPDGEVCGGIRMTSVAVSEDAARDRAAFIAADTRSVSIDQANEDCLESLHEAADEASRPNWNGYDAVPVSDATLAQARALLDLFPSTFPKPDISAHPDGEIAFEWFFGPRRVLTVSVSETGRLSYAAMFGHARVHGTEFLLDVLPPSIAAALRRLYSGG